MATAAGSPHHAHNHRRFFIGPLPEKVVSQQEQLRSKANSFVTEAIQRNAFHLFISRGGRQEDWRESDEQSIVNEMMSRWQDSEWGRFWRRRKENKDAKAQVTRWVGGTFEVGAVVDGVNLLQIPPSIMGDGTPSPPLVDEGTFIPAHTDISPGYSLGASSYNLKLPSVFNHNASESPSSSTALLRPSLGRRQDAQPSKARSEPLRRPIVKLPSSFGARSDTQPLRRNKGKSKAVRYADLGGSSVEPPFQRSGSATEDTSADVTAEPTKEDEVVMSDRMLVRVYHTRLGVGPAYDEAENRTARHLSPEAFKEFLVIWRHNRIELYDNYHLPGKAWFTGHQHLAFLIPLEPSTHLSLYSFVDMTFCLACQPTSTSVASGGKSRWPFRRSREGQNVFICKLKSRSRAVDWMWQIWCRLDGKIPPMIEIRNPVMDTRVRVQVPSIDMEMAFKTFSRQNVIELVRSELMKEPHWRLLIESQLDQGKTLELAWRNGTTLDWVWLDNDVNGKERPWEVLYGLAFNRSSQLCRLEIRLGEHKTTAIRLANGEKVTAPPSIEGYLDRIKPNTGARAKVYLVTHDGNLFSIAPSRAYPPAPPGLQGVGDSLEETEVVRGAMQIMAATDVIDVRNILIVRQAFQSAPLHTHTEADGGTPSNDDWVNVWAHEEEQDQSDGGGDEALSKVVDKGKLRMKRSFELLLKNGRVIRFEAYSRRSAIEWIQGLRALMSYWRLRHRHDALEEMEIARAVRDPITPRVHLHQDGCERAPEAPADENDPMPSLSMTFNRCVLDGCNSIMRGGKLFMRRGLYGEYKLVQLFLVAGHLVWFRVKANSQLNHRARKNIGLLDAYVGSGYFAVTILPRGQYKADTSLPRRYQDGLEADDPEEDTIFAVWYLSTTGDALYKPGEIGAHVEVAGAGSVPPLSVKRKVAVFRTRSKIERNTWCWALNCEVEKLVRAQKDRESKLRAVAAVAQS
ncbi:hypothetical protein BDN71DRAFT_1458507 [Pleurotus eryngii]|uniref:PH domain-containing protein n=1 Tax=Pleurotus eryngii TaxID=5323 RepID=A0A9P5ZHT3_PLEER|nr:hypothetical protein BDN71DRAFT_1458507 [Pleurotus eryngii]